MRKRFTILRQLAIGLATVAMTALGVVTIAAPSAGAAVTK